MFNLEIPPLEVPIREGLFLNLSLATEWFDLFISFASTDCSSTYISWYRVALRRLRRRKYIASAPINARLTTALKMVTRTGLLKCGIFFDHKDEI